MIIGARTQRKNNWGKNAEKKISTFSRNKIDRGWNDLSGLLNRRSLVPIGGIARDLGSLCRTTSAFFDDLGCNPPGEGG